MTTIHDEVAADMVALPNTVLASRAWDFRNYLDRLADDLVLMGHGATASDVMESACYIDALAAKLMDATKDLVKLRKGVS